MAKNKNSIELQFKLIVELKGKLMIDCRRDIIPVMLLSSWFHVLPNIVDVLK